MPGGGRAAYFLALLLAAVLLVGLVRGMPGTSRSPVGSSSSKIQYETQRRAGRDYGVWYATDRLGNITCIEVVELGR